MKEDTYSIFGEDFVVMEDDGDVVFGHLQKMTLHGSLLQ